MEEVYIEDKTFDKADFTGQPLEKGEYEYCIFKGCDFSNSALSDCKFSECEFISCNLSLAALSNTSFRDVLFRDCKMLGLRFDTCQEYGVSFTFENCNLGHSSFYRTKLKKQVFKNVQLEEADFTDADLTGAVFDNCNLANAKFENTTLEKTDFRTAFNYSIDPEKNTIKKAKFSLTGLPGLLGKYDIEIDIVS